MHLVPLHWITYAHDVTALVVCRKWSGYCRSGDGAGCPMTQKVQNLLLPKARNVTHIALYELK